MFDVKSFILPFAVITEYEAKEHKAGGKKGGVGLHTGVPASSLPAVYCYPVPTDGTWSILEFCSLLLLLTAALCLSQSWQKQQLFHNFCVWREKHSKGPRGGLKDLSSCLQDWGEMLSLLLFHELVSLLRTDFMFFSVHVCRKFSVLFLRWKQKSGALSKSLWLCLHISNWRNLTLGCMLV